MLGSFAVFDDRRQIFVSSRRAQALLAYLAMHPGERIDRDDLAELLWDMRSGRDPRHNLRQCLVEIRTALHGFPDLLVSDRDSVMLDPAHCRVDAILFAEAIDGGDLEAAGCLHRGEFLKGLNIDVETFTAWVSGERRRLSSLTERMLEQTARSSLMLSDGAKAIEAAEKLVALDPLDESWQRLLMQAYARFRGRHVAIRQGIKLVALLKRDLDVMPEPETLALLDRIRSGDLVPSLPCEESMPAS